jgi:hypothetical protein
LPNSTNTNWTEADPKPDGFLAFGVSMNFILAVLSMWKLLLLLKTNETMGKLIELVRVCALATVPFLVFFIIWCLIFEILYKALGSEVKAENLGTATNGTATNDYDNYDAIEPALASFFYVFENAVGNVQPPNLDLWTDYLKSRHLPALDYFGIELACFFVYFIWFINQYWMYVILLSFVIAVILNEYNDMQFKKMIYTY